MPKQVMKRPSAKSAPSSPKAKKAKIDPVIKKCESIYAAVMEADELPRTVREMVGTMLMVSLNELNEDRHGYQTQVVEMVAATLNGVEASMQQAIHDAATLVSNGDAEKASRDASLAVAQSNLEAKNEEVKVLKTALDDAKVATKEAKKNHSTAQHTQAEGDVELDCAAAKKEQLEAALRDNFLPLKEGSVVEKSSAKKMFAALNAVGKEHHVDPSMMLAIGVTLGKEVSARGTFDNTALQHFEEDLTRRAAEIASTIESGESARAGRAAAVQATLEALEAAQLRQSASSVSLQQSQDEQKVCESAVKGADKAVHALAPELETAADARDAAQYKLESFREGALANFSELKERRAPPPAPPTPEEPVLPEKQSPAARSPVARSPFASAEQSPADCVV